MEFTKKKIIQKIVAILLVIIITLADFSIIGANVISYALDMVATNSDNVEFFAYFINEKEENINNIESEINKKDLKMCVEVAVKNEGYFNGEITLGDSSFNFSENVSNEYVKEVKGNTVILNQINAGTTAKIELEIQFNNSEVINKISLNQENEINLTGTYVSSKKNIDIKGTTKVQVNWKSPKDIQAQLDTKILTNSIYNVNGVRKRIVQVLIDSKLNNNSYPVRETNIEVDIPSEVEEVKVSSRSTNATNGEQNKYEYNYDLNSDDSKLRITSKNDEVNGNINWNKDAEDIFVVTYLYPESTIFNYEKINSSVSITTYDDKEIKDESQAVISETVDGVVTNEIIQKEEIYKGKIYTGENRNYTSTTVLNIDYAEIVEKIQLLEQEAKFKTEKEEKNANIEFVKTKINKAEFIKLFGEDGYIKILDIKDNVLQTINNASEVDENGNIVVEYDDNIKVIVIETSKPIANGVLNIVHTKSIIDSNLSREEIKELVEIKEEVNSNVTKNDGNNFKNEVTNTIKLKETTMQSKIEINKETLTTGVKNEDIIIQTTLLTYGEDKELYKNPLIKINLPKEIEKIEDVKVRMVNGNGLELGKSTIKEENDIKVIYIELKGEQKQYTQEIIEGTTIQIRLNCNLNELSANQERKITLEISNENSTDVLLEETLIKIVNPRSMIVVNDIKGFDKTENIKLDVKDQAKKIEANVKIINNEKASISNVNILGTLPTDNTKNNMGITLDEQLSINLKDAKIYYTSNENATKDIKNEDNKWQESLSKDSKLYLIVIEKLDRTEKVEIKYEINIPQNLDYNLCAESEYQVTYLDDTTSKEKEFKSTLVKFYTGEEIKIAQDVKASIGCVKIEDGSTVNSGEIIKYNITIENKGNVDINDLTVKGTVPDGTTRVVLAEFENKDAIMSEEPVIYIDYKESSDKEVIFDKIDIKKNEKITLEYEVKVNNNIYDNTKTTAEITSTYNNNEIKSTISHILKLADISTSLNVNSRKIGTVKSGYNYDYTLKITNHSGEDKENLTVKLNNNEILKIVSIYYVYEDNVVYNTNENYSNQFNINKIKAGETITVLISTMVQDKIKNMDSIEISVNVTDNNNITYRSNKIIEKVKTVKVDLQISSTTDSSEKENYVISGNTIEYTITVKNNGDEDANSLVIKDKISNYVTIKDVKLNGRVVSYDKETYFENSNSFTIISVFAPLKAGEECTIEINTIVNEITSNYILEIANQASAYNNILLENISGKTYFVKNKKQNENIVPETGGDIKPEDSTQEEINTYTITGKVWYDENKDGEREEEEDTINYLNVSLVDRSTSEFIKTVQTNENGLYSFTDIKKGEYTIVFEYDTEIYIPTVYQSEGVATSQNSDAIQSKFKINNEYKTVAITDSIKLEQDLSNIDLGLIKAEKFDFELNKYVTKISVVNSSETKTYSFDKSELAKIEIDAKNLKSSKVLIEYTIEVKNTGEVSGYIQNIVDYKPTSLEFSSDLNNDWYKSGSYLYNDSLSNIEIKVGETKEVVLILSRTMTESNTGLINNTAEISKVYNPKGITDVDSVPGNNIVEEDDFGAADVIISIKTGAMANYIVLTMIVLIGIAFMAYLINKKILKKYI